MLKHIFPQLRPRWWTDRHNSPVFGSQLAHIRQCVSKAFEQNQSPGWSPRLNGRLPDASGDGPILMACCDESYFYRFGRQYLLSAALNCPRSRIHLHIYNPRPLCIADAEFLQARLSPRVTVSHEGPERNPYGEEAPFFFAAGRFAVAAMIARQSHAPIMLTDVDGLVRRSPVPELELLRSYDVGLIRREKMHKPWRRILACAVLVNPTEHALRFLERLSSAIHHSLARRPHYHVDQTAIAFLLDAYAAGGAPLHMAPLGMTWGDHRFSPESIIWSAKGARKQQLQGLSLQQARDIILG